MTTEAAAAAAVDAAWVAATLRDLVRIPSVTGSEEAIADHLADVLARLGLAVERVSPDAAAYARKMSER